MPFVSLLQTIGRDFAKGLKYAVEYALPVEKLAALLFPSAAPAITGLEDVTGLIQTAVLLVEQKYAASGVQSGSGQQKLAEVMLLTTQAVTALLSKAGIVGSSDYISKLVSAVVAILNVQPSDPTAAAAGK